MFGLWPNGLFRIVQAKSVSNVCSVRNSWSRTSRWSVVNNRLFGANRITQDNGRKFYNTAFNVIKNIKQMSGSFKPK